MPLDDRRQMQWDELSALLRRIRGLVSAMGDIERAREGSAVKKWKEATLEREINAVVKLADELSNELTQLWLDESNEARARKKKT